MRSAPSAGILSQKSRYALQALLVLAGAGPGQTLQIAAIAQKEGMRTLRTSGLEKARLGVTSLAEINRITTN